MKRLLATAVTCAALFAGPAAVAKEAPLPTTCKVPKDARFEFRLDRVPVAKAAQTVADITCRSIIVDGAVDQVSLTVVTPKGGQYSPAEVYQLFTAALQQAGLQMRHSAGAVLIERAGK